MTASPETRQIYAPNGEMLQLGETIFMPAFADTLTYLAEKGVREFYEGEIAHKLVQDCQDYGGYLTLEDLKNYQGYRKKAATNKLSR
jgi:gamma-glutamyltranspeptidase/glutathione hydrolase